MMKEAHADSLGVKRKPKLRSFGLVAKKHLHHPPSIDHEIPQVTPSTVRKKIGDFSSFNWRKNSKSTSQDTIHEIRSGEACSSEDLSTDIASVSILPQDESTTCEPSVQVLNVRNEMDDDINTLQTAETKAKTTQEQISILQNEIERLKLENHFRQIACDELAVKYRAMSSKAYISSSTNTNILLVSCQSTNTELDLDRELTKLTTKLASYQLIQEIDRETLATLSRENATLQAEKTATSVRHDAQILDLTTRLDLMTQRHHAALAELANVHESFANQIKLHTDAEGEYGKWKSQYDTMKGALERMQFDYERLKRDCQDWQDMHTIAVEKLAQQQSKVDELEYSASLACAERDAMEISFSEMQQEYETLRKSKDEAEMMRLVVEEWKARCNGQEAALENLQREKSAMKIEFEATSNELKETQVQYVACIAEEIRHAENITILESLNGMSQAELESIHGMYQVKLHEWQERWHEAETTNAIAKESWQIELACAVERIGTMEKTIESFHHDERDQTSKATVSILMADIERERHERRKLETQLKEEEVKYTCVIEQLEMYMTAHLDVDHHLKLQMEFTKKKEIECQQLVQAKETWEKECAVKDQHIHALKSQLSKIHETKEEIVQDTWFDAIEPTNPIQTIDQKIFVVVLGSMYVQAGFVNDIPSSPQLELQIENEYTNVEVTSLPNGAIACTSHSHGGTIPNGSTMWSFLLGRLDIIDPSTYKVVVVTKPTVNPHDDMKILNILLQQCRVAAVLLTTSAEMVLHAARMESGLVLDIGHEAIYIVPIFKNEILHHAVKKLQWGASSILERMISLLRTGSSRYMALPQATQVQLAIAIVQTHARVRVGDESLSMISIPIYTGDTTPWSIDLDAELFLGPEILFEKQQPVSLCQAIIESLGLCDPDERKQLSEGIVIGGRLGKLPGLSKRFELELSKMNSTVTFRVHASPHAPAYYGACTFAKQARDTLWLS